MINRFQHKCQLFNRQSLPGAETKSNSKVGSGLGRKWLPTTGHVCHAEGKGGSGVSDIHLHPVYKTHSCVFLLYCHSTIILTTLLTPVVWVFHTSSNSATPTWCPTSQLSSDSVFKELAAEPTGKGCNPTRLPPLQIPLQIARFKL